MTINKSLISIAAATLLVAGFTGCGSSSSSTAAATTTTPTTLTVTDGYVVNFTATATVSDGNSSTSSRLAANTTTVPLPNANVKASIVAGGTQTAGVSTLDLTQDLTTAQIANLVSVNITRAAQVTDGTTLTYASFFDIDSDGTFVAANGDIVAPATLSMSAPAGYTNVTPITTLINARITALTAADTNDTNRTAVTALALTQMAAALGLSETDIQDVDPIGAVTANPTYTLINSMLGQVITDGQMAALATSLATATAATDAASALTNIANAGGLSAAYFTSAADQITADSSFLTGVSSMNLDATRNLTAAQTTFTPITLTAGTADYNVTAIEIGGVDAAALLAAGANVDFADLNSTSLILTADGNNSNARMTLAVSISSQEAYVLDDANISSLSFLVPFDVNSSLGVEAASVAGIVTWEGVTPAGALFTGELNATAFTAAVGTPFNNTDGNITFMIGGMITAIDTNSSSAAAILDGAISSVSIALVDDKNVSSMQRTSGTNGVYWSNASVSATGGTINVTGKGIYKNTLTDGRTGGATVNTTPSMNTILSEDTQANIRWSDDNLTLTNADGDVSNTTLIINKGEVVSIDLNLTVLSNDNDMNGSVVMGTLPSWVTATTNPVVHNGDGTTAVTFDLTVDANSSAVTTETSVITNFTVTDEFGAASTAADTNVTFFYNLSPVIGTVTANQDINATDDINVSAITLMNSAAGDSTQFDCDVSENNASTAGDYTCVVTANGNMIISNAQAGRDINKTVEINATVTDAYGAISGAKTILVNHNVE